VLVGTLVVLVFLAVVQLAIDYHVRNVLAACVAEGARYAANADVADAQAGARRANELITEALGPGFATATSDAPAQDASGGSVVAVTAAARLPLIAWFLPAGPVVRVTGHAFLEPR
jgi:hypothetical protein